MDASSKSALKDRECATCTKKTSRHCLGCFEGLDKEGKLSETFYCSKECQKLDWDTHKLVCKYNRARKQLYRAGIVVRAAFYQYRKTVFDLSISHVEKRGKDFHVWEGLYRPDQIRSPFPTDLVPAHEDQHMLLSLLTGTDGLIRMQALTNMALDGISRDIKEVMFEAAMSNCPRRVVFHRPYFQMHDTRYVQTVLQIRLRDRSVYAFDISGAQHGYYEPVVPWDTYVSQRKPDMAVFKSYGSASVVDERMIKDHGCSIESVTHFTQREISKCIPKHAKVYATKRKTTLADLLDLPMMEYQIKSWDLLAYIDLEMELFLRQADN